MQKLMGLMRRCIDDYDMIQPGDKIAVGVSGGKDSLVLLRLLAGLRAYFNKPFTLEAITIDMGLGMDYSGVEALCRELDVPYTIVKTEIAPIIFDHRKEKNPCSMCAKMRRGALNQAILERGFNKLALGHHYDDAIETFAMNLLFEGRIGCFQPVTNLDRTGIVQIRPMLYIHEGTVNNFARRMALPVVDNLKFFVLSFVVPVVLLRYYVKKLQYMSAAKGIALALFATMLPFIILLVKMGQIL